MKLDEPIGIIQEDGTVLLNENGLKLLGTLVKDNPNWIKIKIKRDET